MSVGLTAVLFGVAAFCAVYALAAPVRPVRGTIDPGVPGAAGAAPGGLFERLVRPAVRNFLPQTPLAATLHARQADRITELLVRSGNPWNIGPEEYVGLRLLAAITGFFLALLAGLAKVLPSALPVEAWMVVGTAIGYFAPKVLLDRARGRRRQAARKGLPEALDLQVITLNAGMNFSPALGEVVARLPEGVIREELTRVTADLRSGKSLSRALLDFARRAPSDEVESFCKAVVQAERLGADVSETLTAQAAAARRDYEAALDERIGKLPTTLYFPILTMMLPALFIAILAPAFANIGRAL